MTRVSLENVSVEFPIYGTQYLSLRNAIAERAIGGLIERDSRHKQGVIVKALTDVTLQLEDGDRLGLVGHNGSGKSTLLKVIAGIYEPVHGKITVNGRITPLFDMMPGLDVDDTGYENILTSGMLLGMSRDQVISKIPEIEEVSELGTYLSLPVRTYSAGMTTRLGFALVTALDPDVLVLDEGFGAADLRFTSRTAERVDELIGRSRAMVLASHSDAMLQSICNKAALLKEGRVMSVGPVEQIFDEYHFMVHGTRLSEVLNPEAEVPEAEMEEEVEKPVEEEVVIEEIEPPPIYDAGSIADIGLRNRLERSTGAVRFSRFFACGPDDAVRWDYERGDAMTFVAEFEVFEPVPALRYYFRLAVPATRGDGQQFVTVLEVDVSDKELPVGHRQRIEVTLPRVDLLPCTLIPYPWLGMPDYSASYDVLDGNIALPAVSIGRGDPSFGGALVEMPHEIVKTILPSAVRSTSAGETRSSDVSAPAMMQTEASA